MGISSPDWYEKTCSLIIIASFRLWVNLVSLVSSLVSLTSLVVLKGLLCFGVIIYPALDLTFYQFYSFWHNWYPNWKELRPKQSSVRHTSSTKYYDVTLGIGNLKPQLKLYKLRWFTRSKMVNYTVFIASLLVFDSRHCIVIMVLWNKHFSEVCQS